MEQVDPLVAGLIFFLVNQSKGMPFNPARIQTALCIHGSGFLLPAHAEPRQGLAGEVGGEVVWIWVWLEEWREECRGVWMEVSMEYGRDVAGV